MNLTGMLVFAAVFGMGGSFVSLLMSKWMAKMSTARAGHRAAAQPTERWLLDTVQDAGAEGRHRHAGGRRIRRRRSRTPSRPGASQNSALVAVSTGLLREHAPEEVRAVLGHEIGHVANGDMVTLTLIQGVLNTFVIFFARIIGSLVDRAVFRSENGYGIGFFVDVDHRADRARHRRQHDRHVVLAAIASFAPTRPARSSPVASNMIGALERLKDATKMPRNDAGHAASHSASPSGIRSGFMRAVRVAPAARRPHRRVAQQAA